MEQKISGIPCALYEPWHTRNCSFNLHKHFEFVEKIFEKMGQSKHLKKKEVIFFGTHIDVILRKKIF